MRSDVRWDARQSTRLLMMGRVAWGGYNRREDTKSCSATSGQDHRAGDPRGDRTCCSGASVVVRYERTDDLFGNTLLRSLAKSDHGGYTLEASEPP
ncbi:hypothetical protein Taro_043523 [Colocasia esculenta]|uniref:Uncharacterized protein n=1 Tax=Colocasia esculenta TaxID=4460 RepID=A0A843WW08_COLES|nr:hypothetical protein [Colocasia esculenta]